MGRHLCERQEAQGEPEDKKEQQGSGEYGKGIRAGSRTAEVHKAV